MLKVPSPQPQANNEMPNDMPSSSPDMDNQEMPTNNFPQQDDDQSMPPMEDDMNDENGNEDGMFDNDFDAGVDTNEEDDPRKYIQQLTGKLSQTLRNYNQQQEKPDVDLCKYVAGMINKQAIKGLTPDDVDEVLKKLKSDDDEDDDSDSNEDMDFDEPENDETPDSMTPDDEENQNGDVPQNMPMESIERRKAIDELFQDITSDQDDNETLDNQQIRQKSYRKSPYLSPDFK